MTSQGTAHGRFARALAARNVRNAEDAARELGSLGLDDALALVRLYGETGSEKFERAALRYLERVLVEGGPSLLDVAQLACTLVEAGRGDAERQVSAG